MPKNVIGHFLTSIVLQTIKKLKGRPFGGIEKASKSRIVPKKNPSEKHHRVGSYVIEVMDVDVFVLDEVLAFRVCFGCSS